MSIARHGTRTQISCDTCPASYPNTYAAEDFGVMVADAKTAGWLIRKVKPQADKADTSDLFGSEPKIAGSKPEEPFTHTCPSCQHPIETEGLF